MKSIPAKLLTGCILFIATTGLLPAQDNNVAFNVKTIVPDQGAVTAISPLKKLPETAVNIRAVRDFVNQFKQTDSVSWFKVRDGYIVNFLYKGDLIRTGYDLNGNWLYDMVSYPEDKLPHDVWHLVKSIYYDFSITWVNEIKKGYKKIYIVHLKNKYFFQNVRVCDGESEVIERLMIDALDKNTPGL